MTTPQVNEIEARAKAANVALPAVLKRAGVAQTTWGRWSKGTFEPRLATLRRLDEALEAEIAHQDAAA